MPKSFLYSKALMIKSLAQTLSFKSMMDKHCILHVCCIAVIMV